MSSIDDYIEKCSRVFLDKAITAYECAHSRYPTITNYTSTAIGVVGGDAIAKQFSNNSNITLRDIAFTSAAAVAYSYLAPKMIEWSTAATEKLASYWSHIKNSKSAHTIVNTTLLTAMYFPVNMAYWNYLTIKNQAPVTWSDNEVGAITLGLASIPYFLADYIAITKLSTPQTTKYLRLFYSGVELLWNTLFAAGNYVARR